MFSPVSFVFYCDKDFMDTEQRFIFIYLSIYHLGAAMFGVLLLLLLSFTSQVALVPPARGPLRSCRRCCDHLEQDEGSGSSPPFKRLSNVPEVRTYINMTILKGERP